MLKKIINFLFGIKEKKEYKPKIDVNSLAVRNQRCIDDNIETCMRNYERSKRGLKPYHLRAAKKRVCNASNISYFNNNTSTHYVDDTPSIVQAAVLYSVLQDSSEPTNSRVDSYSSDCTRISHDTYASSSSDSYSSCDSSSSYSGSYD